MSYHAWRPAPLMALALAAACQRGERPSAVNSVSADSPSFASPASAAMRERAPATFRARFETSKGDVVIEVHRDWAPLGADRLYNLVRRGYLDGVRFFRVSPGFLGRFGIAGEPHVAA